MDIHGNIFPDRRVGTTAGFHCPDAPRFQALIPQEKLRILPGKNIVGHHRQT